MSAPAATMPVPAPIPEFLAPRTEAIRHALRTGWRQDALVMARTLFPQLTESYGSLHNYPLHSLELLPFCTKLAGHPSIATDVSIQVAKAWQHLLSSGTGP